MLPPVLNFSRTGSIVESLSPMLPQLVPDFGRTASIVQTWQLLRLEQYCQTQTLVVARVVDLIIVTMEAIMLKLGTDHSMRIGLGNCCNGSGYPRIESRW